MKALLEWRGPLIAATLVCGVVGVLLLVLPGEPSYGGRRLSMWVEDVTLPPYEEPAASNAVHAIRQIGTNALPFLMRQLQTKNSPLRMLGFWLKNKRFVNFLSTRSAAQVRFDAALALRALGPAAEPTIPELTRLLHLPASTFEVAAILPVFGRRGYLVLSTGLTNSNWIVRRLSADNLIMLEVKLSQDATNELVMKYRREANVAIPALIEALEDTDPRVLDPVITALDYIRQEPERVIPALEKFLADPQRQGQRYKSPRYAAEAAIRMFALDASGSGVAIPASLNPALKAR